MKNFKTKSILLLSLSLFLIPACEDTGDEPNRPEELVGSWAITDADGVIIIGSNVSQKGANMFAKGQSSINLYGTHNAELAYMIVNLDGEDEDEDGPDVILSNRSIWEMDEENPTYPMIYGFVDEDDMTGEKALGLQVMLSKTEGGLYIGTSDYVLDSLNFSLTISSDTAYARNMSTGLLDSSKYYIADGTFQAATFTVNASDSVVVDFPLIVQGIKEEQIQMDLRANGDVTHYFTDEFGQGEDHGEWYTTDENVLVMIMDLEGKIDTLAFPYVVNGTDLTLIMNMDACEFFGDFFDDNEMGAAAKFMNPPDCFDPIEMMFLLQENSVTSARMKANMYFVKAVAK
ncbi:MAG: hypothetical protein HOD10_01925 [Candidatus Marinimicrobia bacterium]|nr:hypothetical protein [Candidatus Neomarinimicrobiota bacterium]MBT3676450.1 hypothetical protein [Candidatus Neomarinimicrobiota bacterium]MBT4269895.1 hypothetical protein [Candidatus Neomarinimicrobiota bacterium]MBT4371538.1 hypothetical protein [Candidatus Neomarinimicrobiota bacterium]MBT4809638.1 hypothetical protein [Candidatus Neomarinimicrobiota bacterium]